MHSMEAFQVKEGFAITQAEIDAVEILLHLPEFSRLDRELHNKVSVFKLIFAEKHETWATSPEADALLLECAVTGDYSVVKDHLPEYRSLVEAMFEQAGFDCGEPLLGSVI